MSIAEFWDLQDLPPRYETFFAEQASISLFLSKHWFENMISNGMEDHAIPYLVALEEPSDGSPQIGLVMRSPAGQNGSVFSKWKFGGQTLSGLTNFQSSYYSPLLTSDSVNRSNQFRAFAQALARKPKQWSFIDLNLLDPKNPNFSELVIAFKMSGFHACLYPYKGNWYEDISAHSFDEYLKTRTKSSRRAIQNYRRKFRRLQAAERVCIEILTGDHDLDRLVSQYEKIYALSWKDTEYFPNFIPGLIRACAAEGSLRMVFVKLDGKPVAVEFAVVTGKQAVMMKTAYDPEFGKESVGAIAVMKAVEHLIEVDNITNIDFGTDDDPYKSIWVASRRERWGLALFNRHTFLGNYYYLRYLFSNLVHAIRRKLKVVHNAMFGDR